MGAVSLQHRCAAFCDVSGIAIRGMREQVSYSFLRLEGDFAPSSWSNSDLTMGKIKLIVHG